jgi:hypothetical protein
MTKSTVEVTKQHDKDQVQGIIARNMQNSSD